MQGSDEGDFAFHWEGGGAAWEHLHVVSFTMEDGISEPFRVRLVLHARHPEDEVDPADLIGRLATLRIRTGAEPPLRFVHGLIVEAMERGPSETGMTYEVTLRPPLARMIHRRRSRIFLEKSLRQIVEAVLATDAGLAPIAVAPVDGPVRRDYRVPVARFALRLRDVRRFDDPAARAYCVQYEESDLDFVTRILEEEGISYHHEHFEDAVVLVVTDHDGGRARLEPFTPLSPAVAGRHLSGMRLGHRLRSTQVRLREVDWRRPSLDLTAEAQDGDGDLFIAAYPGGYDASGAQGAPLAEARLDQLRAEASFATGEGACRLLCAGTIFAFAHGQSRHEGEYLVSRAELRGYAGGELAGREFANPVPDGTPFQVRVECVRRGVGAAVRESRYRAPRRVNRPRIQGTQTAIVADEPDSRGAEIHVGGPPGYESGCVRVRFPWDTDAARHAREPTSCWVRVSQSFSGAGFGAVFHPRVGTEVIVDHLDGDPERPIVVGRVYNGAQHPPAGGHGAATVSTMKSLSSPGAATFNELSFEDAAGREEVRLFAGRDWTTTVGNDRSESVRNVSLSSVGGTRHEETGADRSTRVRGKNAEAVEGDESIIINGGRQVHVAGTQEVDVAGTWSDTAGVDYELRVGAAMTVSVGSSWSLTAPETALDGGKVAVKSTTADMEATTEARLCAGLIAAAAAGEVSVQGARIALAADEEVVISAGGSAIRISGSGVEISGAAVKIAGGTVDIVGSVVKVN